MTDEERLEVLQGTLQLLILRTLRWGPAHGQGIARFIEQTSRDLRIEHGSLYPALQRLMDDGYIDGEWGTSENGRRARFYRLTAAGKRQLTREESRWQRFTQAVGRMVAPASSED